MSKLLIIGGTGFFGKSILDLFQRDGLACFGIDTIVSMSRNAGKLQKEAPWLVSKNVELISADICNVDYIPDADFIIHAAASTDARNYLAQPLAERLNIQAGTANFCGLAKKHLARSKILYVSSGAIYGTQPPDMQYIDESYKYSDENDISEIKRDYAYAKRDAELMVQELGMHGLSVSIARCFAFVGPWLPLDQHFAIGNFLGDVTAGRPIAVKAKHKVYRSYLYADDLVEWLLAIVKNSNPSCPIYNVGSDQAVEIAELATMIASRFDNKLCLPSAVNNQVVDRYIPAISKICSELGVSIKYDIESAINETLKSINKKI